MATIRKGDQLSRNGDRAADRSECWTSVDATRDPLSPLLSHSCKPESAEIDHSARRMALHISLGTKNNLRYCR